MAFPGTAFTNPAVAQTATLSRISALGATPTAALGSEGTMWYILANLFTTVDADKYFPSRGGAITSTSATGGIGYATGAGTAVTQGTSRTTTVASNGLSGQITLFTAAGSATPATFTVTNTAIGAGDVVVWTQKSGADKYEIFTTNVVAVTSFACTFFTTGGTTSEVVVFSYAIIRAVAA